MAASKSPRLASGKTIRIDARTPEERVVEVLRALGHEARLGILQHLADRVMPVSQLAVEIGLPPSTAAMHVNVLERAGLLHTEMRSATRGLQKVCARTYDEVVIDLPRAEPQSVRVVELSMPVGGYSECEVAPTCGLASATQLIGYLDDPASFYEPERLAAQLLWFGHGWVEYRLPSRLPPRSRPTVLQVSAEICSEAPLHDANWPSDITVWVNGREIGTWTSPGDFGGDRGRYTPEWWETKDTQYGVLKRWRVAEQGTTIDGTRLSDVRVSDLGLTSSAPITVRIGVKADAAHVGGLNLFGRRFGNYQQDLALRLEYEAGSSRHGVARRRLTSAGERARPPTGDALP